LSSLQLPEEATGIAAVPYSAASHGKDYWLSPGVPHCADCHAPPYVEGQGGVAFPINQPGKYSVMRYSKGHAGLACQACHESIHGLYPVTPTVDPTTYKQATQYNPDGSHGPLLCASCHETNKSGVPIVAEALTWKGKKIKDNLDAAISWIHSNAPDLGGKNLK
jgi:ribosomal protein L34E